MLSGAYIHDGYSRHLGEHCNNVLVESTFSCVMSIWEKCGGFSAHIAWLFGSYLRVFTASHRYCSVVKPPT